MSLILYLILFFFNILLELSHQLCLESPLSCRKCAEFLGCLTWWLIYPDVQWVIHQKALSVCSHVTLRPDPPAVTGCLSVCLTLLNSSKFPVISLMVLPLIVVTPSVCPHSLLYARLHQPLTRGPSLPSAACCPAPLLILSNQRAAILLLHSVDSQSGNVFSTDVCFDLIHKIFKLVFKQTNKAEYVHSWIRSAIRRSTPTTQHSDQFGRPGGTLSNDD